MYQKRRCAGSSLWAKFLLALPAQAGFWDGLTAYDAGNFAEAREQWRSVAEIGETEAQASLADLCKQGLGVPWNFEHAAQWFRRAAAQGHAIAQLNLGDYYARGRGVPLDLAQAWLWLWLSLAARQGDNWAEEPWRAVETQMTEPALKDAIRRLAKLCEAIE